jgi:hypothetical protein
MAERLRSFDWRVPNASINAALETFHTTLFIVVVLALIYAFGDLGDALDGLNTFAGLGLCSYL